jgi:hypothetical protein
MQWPDAKQVLQAGSNNKFRMQAGVTVEGVFRPGGRMDGDGGFREVLPGYQQYNYRELHQR